MRKKQKTSSLISTKEKKISISDLRIPKFYQDIGPLLDPIVGAWVRYSMSNGIPLHESEYIEILKSEQVLDQIRATKAFKMWDTFIKQQKDLSGLKFIATLLGEEDENLPFLLVIEQSLNEQGLKINKVKGESNPIPSLISTIGEAENALKLQFRHMMSQKEPNIKPKTP